MLKWLMMGAALCLCSLGAAACAPESTGTKTPPDTAGRESAAAPSDTPTPSPPTSTSAASPSPASRADLAPDFSFTLAQGQDVLGADRLSQLRGKPVVLNFWARLCGPCWQEMPELQGFYEEYHDQVEFLGIDIGEYTGYGSYLDSTKLLQSIGITYPVGFTKDGNIVRKYRVEAIPTTIFISGDGEIFQKWTGALDRDSIIRVARAMLREEPSR